jgi:hypothetical protein
VSTCHPDIPPWAVPDHSPVATPAEWLNVLLGALGQIAPQLMNTAARWELGEVSLLLHWAYRKLHPVNPPTWPQPPDRPAPHLLAEAAGLLHALYLVHGCPDDDACPGVCSARATLR